MHVFNNATMHVCKCMLVCKYANFHQYKYASMQICKDASMFVCKYICMQVCMYENKHLFKYASIQLCFSTLMRPHLSLFFLSQQYREQGVPYNMALIRLMHPWTSMNIKNFKTSMMNYISKSAKNDPIHHNYVKSVYNQLLQT